MSRVMVISNVSGGLFSFRRELIERLAKTEQVTILASDTGHIEDFRAMGCEVLIVAMDRHGMNPLVERKLLTGYKRILREKKPDIVLTYTIKPNIYAGMACASMGIPYVANITGLGIAVEKPGVMQKVMLRLYRHGLRKAQKVFFQNKANMEFLTGKHVIKGPYQLIPGSGVNLERYQVLPYPPDETVEFVFIARIIREKGIDQYLDAARCIRAKYPNTRFHICGRCGDDYRQTLSELNDNGTVIYHGLVGDIAAIHRQCACTVHPSYYPEGMSNVLLEACACGRPIITTDRPGCGEIVDDGVNGYVVRQKDSKDLIEKIERFLALPAEKRREMGLAGRAKAEREFDRRIVVDAYLDEVRKAAKQ
ncbi:MAG: glycosyltransferase family 4 protein [Clostridia bacterium]|nr:glycosyltransferase family 4 protein [Clostridia bacterium]